MGGPGSTRWGGYRGRTAAESCPSVSLADVNKMAASGRIEWKDGIILQNVILAADFYLENISEDEKELSLTPEGGPLQTIRIVKSHTRPRRWYLHCPFCEEREERFRRQRLYLIDGLIGCRTRHNLDHLSHLRGNYKKRETAGQKSARG